MGVVAQENKLDGNAAEIVQEQEKEKTAGELVEAAEKLSKQVSSKPLDSVADMTKEAKEKSRVKVENFFLQTNEYLEKTKPENTKRGIKTVITAWLTTVLFLGGCPLLAQLYSLSS